MTETKNTFFKPEKLSPQAKADQTTSVARDILASEVAARQKKTEKLRALRLAQPVPEAPVKKVKAAKKR
ncbi:hypothetical protein FHX08_001107 [Rhizobium sp. BK529]|uniref:hypothetical protein n=1 Tax=unclassified Rhizobium TaxID=2613769 RepID=UPI00104E6787|nr:MULTISPECIES: hypothetical protein [unclassified Rhizobium]MBB3590763.1 hypothetical protein [Rhizobium sp. BK529]TCS09280.1 hypothetical protein EV281_1011161 [Rhizobium sp. BK418]